jgi:outer membrane protein OmpA-like peptidoglycan-associated protein
VVAALVLHNAWAQPAPPSAPATPESVAAAPDVKLDFLTSLDALFAAWPGLKELTGAATMHVDMAASTTPGVSGTHRLVTIHCEDARYARLPLGKLDLRLWTPAGSTASELVVDIRGPAARVLRLEASLQVEIDPRTAQARWGGGLVQAKLQLEGLDLARLTAAYPVLAATGLLDGQVTVSGTSADPTLTVSLGARDLQYRGEPLGSAAVVWNHYQGVSRIEARWGEAATPIVSGLLELPLAFDLQAGEVRWLDDRPMQLRLNAPAITPARVKPFWTAPDGLDFTLGLAISGGGTLDNLAIHGELKGRVKSGSAPEQPLTVAADLRSADQALRISLGNRLVDVDLRSRIPLPSVRRSGLRPETGALSGQIALALPLALLQPFLSSGVAHPAGTFDGNIAVGGTLGTPTFTGSVATHNAAITLLPLNQRIERLSINGTLSRDTLTLRQIGGKAGRGALTGAGRIKLEATPSSGAPREGLWSAWKITSRFDLELLRLPVLQDGFPIGTARGKARIDLVARPGSTSALLAFRDGKVVLVEHKMHLPASIPSNPAVRVLDWLGKLKPSDSILEGSGRLKLDVLMVTPLTVEGPGGSVALTGRMVLDRRGSLARVDGGLTLVPGGVFHLFDNPFVIRSGVVTLLGGDIAARKTANLKAGAAGQVAMHDRDAAPLALPLDVVVDVLAEGTTVDTRVATEIRGPMRMPELLLASDPPLPEYQILTLLITGRVDTVDEHDGEVRRQVARLVEQFHNPSLGRQLYDRLGVDKIGVGFGASVSEPILTVGRQINRQLYLESVYHHNAPEGVNAREGHAQYRLDPHWTVDTAFGDAAAGSAGIHWQISFGGTVRPRLGDTISLFGKTRLPTDSDGDRLANERDRCPFEAEDADGYRDDDGCIDGDNDNDGVPDGRDALPMKAETINQFRDDDGVPDTVPPRLDWRGGMIRTLTLERNSAELTPEAQATLDAALQVLKDFPDMKVEIAGHSDDRGTPARIRVIADERAKRVRDYLERGGIGLERMNAVGYGADRPADASDTEEARAKNRRIEMTLTW